MVDLNLKERFAVFDDDADYEAYLKLLGIYLTKYRVQLWCRSHFFVRVASIEFTVPVAQASMMLSTIDNRRGWLSRSLNIVAYLAAENLALRQQSPADNSVLRY
jgi:hypothetical protein